MGLSKRIILPGSRTCPTRARLKMACVLVVALSLSACGFSQPVDGIQDPNERLNRRIHAENIAFDRFLFRPASKVYGRGIPMPIRRGIGNFAGNLNLPRVVVNNILQFRIGKALKHTGRFVINTTLGMGGLLDPATPMGVEEDRTNFGETLYVWGFKEGNFMELPLLGPSTDRATVGMIVDLFTNPLVYMVPSPENAIGVFSAGLSKVGDRYEYSSTIDSILYESEDSYAQARSLYLQNRRFELGVEVTDDEVDEIDSLFEDLYGE